MQKGQGRRSGRTHPALPCMAVFALGNPGGFAAARFLFALEFDAAPVPGCRERVFWPKARQAGMRRRRAA